MTEHVPTEGARPNLRKRAKRRGHKKSIQHGLNWEVGIYTHTAAAAAKSLQSCPALLVDGSLPGDYCV